MQGLCALNAFMAVFAAIVSQLRNPWLGQQLPRVYSTLLYFIF